MLKLSLKGCTPVKCSIYYFHYLGLHYLWLHLVDILVVKCRKKQPLKSVCPPGVVVPFKVRRTAASAFDTTVV